MKAVKEMLRVSKDQVRIYPLVKHRSKKSAFLLPVLKSIAHLASPEIIKVDYQFRKGGNEMLVLNKK
jgi:hypothetical protein